MGRTFIGGRAGFGRFFHADQPLFHLQQSQREFPDFRLQFERDAVEPLEIVLQMGHSGFQADHMLIVSRRHSTIIPVGIS